ncbi:MAG TPA: cytochrome c oxidase subunit 3 family protein [Aromatoleum sp.]|nr:cytochrome c oxidase subunit 3 family protein [Aromatoleum sp.]HJV28871.1 cytochrome c oxidase subunit 3 family protein [Aromatoleum sp.]
MPPLSVQAEQAETPADTERRLHGDLAIWFFILAELLAFGAFFVAYAFTRAHNVEVFNAQQLGLDRTSGAINTVLLLTSSFLVVRAVQLAEAGRSRLAARWVAGAFACGAGFVVVKSFEYAAKFAAGVSLSSSTFDMFYLVLTFFHFMHVILGLVILAALWNGARQGRYRPDNMNGIETGAAYWHMVDLVWLILFPLVYVMR